MRSTLIYLDTHVIVWLYSGDQTKFSDNAKELINRYDLYISPIVTLELQYLYEIKRVSINPNEIVSDLSKRIGLKVCQKQFQDIINKAISISWTRDPFDRLITANAALDNDILLSKDITILENYEFSQW